MWLSGEISVGAVTALLMSLGGLASMIGVAVDARGRIPAAGFGAACALFLFGILQLRRELVPAAAELGTMLAGIAIGMMIGVYLCWWIVRRKPKPERQPPSRTFAE